MAEKFSVGEVVQLKSGSVPMTVVLVEDEYGRTHTAWMHEGEMRSTYAPTAALMKVSEA